MLTQEFKQSSVILLVDGKSADGGGSVRKWLEQSRFSMVEVSDVFQALEEMSDFTIRSRPDVILMEVGSLTEDFPVVRNVVQTSSAAEDQCPIFVLSDSGEIIGLEECFKINFNELQGKLDDMIPQLLSARAVA